MTDTTIKDLVSRELRGTFGSYGQEQIIHVLGPTLDGIEGQLNVYLRAAIQAQNKDYDEDQIEELEVSLGQHMSKKFTTLITNHIKTSEQNGLTIDKAAAKLNDTLSNLTDDNLKKISQENVAAVLTTPTNPKKKPKPSVSVDDDDDPIPSSAPPKPKPKPAAQRPTWASSSGSSGGKGGSWSSRASSSRSGGK